MRKYKHPPKKPGYYIAWYYGDELFCQNKHITHPDNAKYWDGKRWWHNGQGRPTMFMYPEYPTDRWSYLPKGHPYKEKKEVKPYTRKRSLYI